MIQRVTVPTRLILPAVGSYANFPDLISLMYGEARMQLYGAT